ncbi:MAG: hypothetical protein LBH96_06225 [Candidatus Peribacteria bacterium]|nr:hypothetical protein [Candidatus Peribacteria bacterium]
MPAKEFPSSLLSDKIKELDIYINDSRKKGIIDESKETLFWRLKNMSQTRETAEGEFHQEKYVDPLSSDPIYQMTKKMGDDETVKKLEARELDAEGYECL